MNYDGFKKRCKEKGYSASSLVTELGISKSNITNWRNGGNPSYKTLIKISEKLDCSIGFLIGTENEYGNKTDIPDRIMNTDEMNSFIERVGKDELYEEIKNSPHAYPKYLKAVRVTLVAMGYSEKWVETTFRNALEDKYL